jgi:hypothetical protein
MAAKSGWKHKPKPPRLREKKALRAAHNRLAVAIKKLGIKKIHDDFQALKDKITASDC